MFPFHKLLKSITMKLTHGACLFILSSFKVEGLHKYRSTHSNWNCNCPGNNILKNNNHNHKHNHK